MLIHGRWTLCDDGIFRPVMEGELLTSAGSWLPVELLVDVGADRSVITAGGLANLALPQLPSPHQPCRRPETARRTRPPPRRRVR
jgi:hypothetical protein